MLATRARYFDRDDAESVHLDSERDGNVSNLDGNDDGSQRDERGTYGAGALAVNRPGEEHSVHSDDGCTVLIFWQKPVEFLSHQ